MVRNRVCAAVRLRCDPGARRIWVGVNGNWASGQGNSAAGLAAGQASGGDPAAGLGGWDLSSLGADLLPTAVLRNLGDDFRFAFDGAGFAYLPPAGFTAL